MHVMMSILPFYLFATVCVCVCVLTLSLCSVCILPAPSCSLLCSLDCCEFIVISCAAPVLEQPGHCSAGDGRALCCQGLVRGGAGAIPNSVRGEQQQ
jgi:hypothetical protein